MNVKNILNGIALCMLLMALCPCACKNKDGESSSSGAQILMGFSQIGAESAWRKRNTQSVLEAAEQNGIQLIFDDAEQKQANQLKAIRSFIVYRVDVIAFVPIVEDGWDNVLREAKEAHIPVLIVDRKIKTSDESLYAGYIGEDSIEEGRKAARFLLQKYEDVRGPLNIMEITGTVHSSVARERSAGFREVLNGYPKFSIVYSESADFLRSRGQEVTEQIIQFNGALKIGSKPVHIIFSHNDAMTLGLLDALNHHNINAGTDVTIVSIDAEQKAINALKDGRINCEIECNPELGPELMRLVKTIANRNTIPKFTYIKEQVFTETDDLSAIGIRKY